MVAHKEKAGCNRTLGFDRLSVSRPDWRKRRWNAQLWHTIMTVYSRSAVSHDCYVSTGFSGPISIPSAIRTFLSPSSSLISKVNQFEAGVVVTARMHPCDPEGTIRTQWLCSHHVCTVSLRKKKEKNSAADNISALSGDWSYFQCIAVFTLLVYCLCRLQAIRWEAGRFRLVI